MPYKDPEKRRAVQKKSKQNLYHTTIQVYIPKSDDPLYDNLTAAANKYQISIPEYLRIAAKEKLQRDNVVAVTASPAELRAIGITKSHRSRPRRRIRLGVIPEKPDKP